MIQESEIYWTFLMRIFYSGELLFCGTILLLIRTQFQRSSVRAAFLQVAIWLYVLAFARAVGSVVDYCFETGVGFLPVLVNNLFWLYVCYKITRFVIKLLKSKKLKKAVSITEQSLNEFDELLRENNDKLEDIERQLKERL